MNFACEGTVREHNVFGPCSLQALVVLGVSLHAGAGLTAFSPSCADCLEIWDLNLLELSGPVQGLLLIGLYFCYYLILLVLLLLL